jgi:hypothetical protein
MKIKKSHISSPKKLRANLRAKLRSIRRQTKLSKEKLKTSGKSFYRRYPVDPDSDSDSDSETDSNTKKRSIKTFASSFVSGITSSAVSSTAKSSKTSITIPLFKLTSKIIVVSPGDLPDVDAPLDAPRRAISLPNATSDDLPAVLPKATSDAPLELTPKQLLFIKKRRNLDAEEFTDEEIQVFQNLLDDAFEDEVKKISLNELYTRTEKLKTDLRENGINDKLKDEFVDISKLREYHLIKKMVQERKNIILLDNEAFELTYLEIRDIIENEAEN